MTRTGVGYVGMVAAAITVGALGYAVFWAYGEPDASSVTISVPPAARSSPPTAAPSMPAETPAPPVREAASSTAPSVPAIAAAPTSPIQAPNEARAPVPPPASVASNPVNVPVKDAASAQPRVADAAPPMMPDRRVEKPAAATAPKELLIAKSAAVPVTTPPRPPGPSVEKPTVATAPKEIPNAETAAAAAVVTAPRSAPTVPAERLTAMPAQSADTVIAPRSPESHIATAAPALSEKPDIASADGAPNTAAVEIRNAATPAAPVTPPALSRSAARTPDAAASALAQPQHMFRAVPKKVEQTTTRPRGAIAPAPTPKKHAALPRRIHTPDTGTPRETHHERPQIVVVRGRRQPSSTPRLIAPEKSRIAALPSRMTATDAPSILVLRGRGSPRYALVSAAKPSTAVPPLLAVMRGWRPRHISLQNYVQPSALILHIKR
jgi:hypothetical protein